MLMHGNTGNQWRSDRASDAAKCADHEYGIRAWEYGGGGRFAKRTPTLVAERQGAGGGEPGKLFEPLGRFTF